MESLQDSREKKGICQPTTNLQRWHLSARTSRTTLSIKKVTPLQSVMSTLRTVPTIRTFVEKAARKSVEKQSLYASKKHGKITAHPNQLNSSALRSQKALV